MHRVKIGVVGLGHLGSKHVRVYQQLTDCSLEAICDIDTSRFKPHIDSFKGLCSTNYKDLLDKVDAVSIAVPTNLHYKIASFFLQNKKHALVEKPFTTNIQEADKLIRIAHKNKLVLQVGHVERFNSAFSAVQKHIREPKFIECHRLSPFPNRSLDIGVVLDLMIHDIDIVLGLVNSPFKRIEAVGVPVLTPFEDIANARISFQNGCVCNLTASRISEEWLRKIRIFLPATYISLDYKNEEASIYKKLPSGITKESLPIEKEEPLKKELESFLQTISQKSSPIVSGEVARDALMVAIEVQKRIWKNIKYS